MRWLVSVALVLAANVAEAAVSMSPNPLDTGGALIGNTAMVNGMLSSTINQYVDLVITSCSGAGGTFAFTPNTNINLNFPKTIALAYTPSARGTRACTARVYEHNTTNQVGSFTIRGTGLAPQTMDVSAASADFGSVRWNNAAALSSTTQMFTVQNTGDVALTITNVSLGGANAGDFAIVSGGTAATIAPLGVRTWTIRFDPTVSGARSATLTFTGDAPGDPDDQASLTGTGTNAVINVTDAMFGVVNTGSAAPLDITVSNVGNAPKGNLGVTSAMISGGGGWFSFAGCGGGTTCTFVPPLSIIGTSLVGVRCSPPVTASANDMQMATVTFLSDTDTVTDNVATLMCTAGKSDLATNLNTVMFAPQLVTSTSTPMNVVVTNTGNVASTFYLSKTGGNQAMFSLSTGNGCGLTGTTNQCAIGPAQTFTFAVTFTPGFEGDINAGVTLVPSPGTPTQLTLTGRGVDRHIAAGNSVVAPDTYRASHSQVLVPIRNTGEYPLQIEDVALEGAGVWSLEEPQMPFAIPGLTQHDIVVRFSPLSTGKAPDGTLSVMSDDRLAPLVHVILSGNGKDRNVHVDPLSIDFGDRAAGTVSLHSAVFGRRLALANEDEASFVLREVRVSGDDVFRAEHAGFLVRDLELPIGASAELEVAFAPEREGEYSAMLELYFDDDLAPHTLIEVRGRALSVDIHGGGGCSTGSGAPGTLLALLALRRRRRR